MRIADVIGNAAGLRARQDRAQIVAVLGQPADDESVVGQGILRAHATDHLARQHRAVATDHRESSTGKAAAAGPGRVGRPHDRVHRAVEQRERARQAPRASVRGGDRSPQLSISRVVGTVDGRICRGAAQPGELHLIQRKSPQARENRRDFRGVRRGGSDARMHAQLGQPRAGLAQQAQRLFDPSEEAGHAAEAVMRVANAVDRNSHHDAPEGCDGGDAREEGSDLLGVGAIRRDAERAHPAAVVGRDDLGEVVAQQGLAAGEGQVADRPGACRDAADAREVELGVSSDRVPLRHVEAVAAQRVAAVGQELDQVARRTARQQAAEVGEHDREIDRHAAQSARRDVPQRQQAAGDDGGAGCGMERKSRRHAGRAMPARELAHQCARLPARHAQQQQGRGHQLGEHEAGGYEQQADHQCPAPYPFARAPHHRIEAAIAPDELQVVARARDEFAHVIGKAGLPVLDAQLARQPQPVTGRGQPASQVGVFERDTAILAEAAQLEEHSAADRTHRAAEAAGRAAIETAAAHDGFARVEITRETSAARVVVVVAARDCVVTGTASDEADAATQEVAIADARVGIEEHQPLTLCRACAGVARCPRPGAALVAQQAHLRATGEQSCRRVSRSVIDDDEFATAHAVEALRFERVEQAVDGGRGVARGDDYGDLHALDVCMKRVWILGAWACILRAPADVSVSARTFVAHPSQPSPSNEFS
ncbi:Uncharacterized protein ToN1_28470 [Aromatoleum petrolei]|nr:Uncharacterized protein ToN1_28470 [Aromatoleum petrolei]